MDFGIIKKDYENCEIFFAKELYFDPIENFHITPPVSSNPQTDWIAQSYALRCIIEEFPNDEYKIVEVGCAHGHGTRQFFNYMEIMKPGKSKVYGIDSKLHGYCPCMFVDGMEFVDGTSSDVLKQFYDNSLHFVFIDACHCSACTYRDAINYSVKVKKGGYIAFHDTSPKFQGGTEQPRTPDCAEDTHIGCVKAIEKWNPCSNGFEFVLEEIPKKEYWGGVTLFRKIR